MIQATASVVVGPYTVTLTDLGLLPGGIYASGYAINNSGLVAGMAYNSAGGLERALWNNGVMTTIPNFDPSSTLIPNKLNDGGHLILNEFIGKASINYAIWREPNGTYHQLPPFPGGDPLRVHALGINTAGVIAGYARESNLGPFHGVIWQNGSFLRDIGLVLPQDINDLGQVVGATASTAFLWQNGTIANLGALSPGAVSSAYAINNTGTIVGTSNGGFPVRWVNGQISSLPVPNGVIQPRPVDVNDAGDIIGWGTSSAPGVLYASAFWRNGQPILLPAWPGATQTLARSINNRAEIVGEGPIVSGGPQHALKWTITTGNPPPTNTTPNVTLAATTPTTIRVGGAVTLRGTFADPDNGPWSYTFMWKTGSTTGTTTTAGSIVASRTYSTKGTFKVRLAVTDASGAVGTSNTISVIVR
ncbi:MAG: PKD domain-containing protein [Gemmatimonas sp.]